MGRKAQKKHLFDCVIILAVSPVLIPLVVVCAVAILLLEGRPIFYRSERRVFRHQSTKIAKFRTMRRDAERIANRVTVPISTTRFLNIPSDSPLYTGIGRLIERCMLTEMPQIYYVLRGQMSLVGNRPLPENVIAALAAEHDDVEVRFLSPTGLTGPAQLVGRDFISDSDRLRLEGTYSRVASQCYSARLDLMILIHTVLIGVMPGRRFTPDQVLDLIVKHAERKAGGLVDGIVTARREVL